MFALNQPQKQNLCSSKRLKSDLNEQKLEELNDYACRVEWNCYQEEFIQLSIEPLTGPFINNLYQFLLDFRTNYPYRPPLVLVRSNIQHPNIDLKTRKIFVQFLDPDQWKPTQDLYQIIKAIKHTIVNIDFSYIPNNINCIKSAQRIGKQDHSTDEEELDDGDFQMSDNFKLNFELPLQQRIDIEIEEKQYDTDEEKPIQRSDQQPAIINLTQTQRKIPKK